MTAQVVECRLGRHGQCHDAPEPLGRHGRCQVRGLGTPVVADHHRLRVAPERLVRREDVSHQRFG